MPINLSYLLKEKTTYNQEILNPKSKTEQNTTGSGLKSLNIFIFQIMSLWIVFELTRRIRHNRAEEVEIV
jgi:hypothetical protein